MATILQLLGIHFPAGTLLSHIGAKPLVGTENDHIVKWAIEFMPVSSHGEDTYQGGLAMANIQNKDSGIGHYVVLLGVQDDLIRYWCPLLGSVFEEKEEDIIWKNSTGEVIRWSINFETEEDFYHIEPTPERHIFVLRNTNHHDTEECQTSQLVHAAYEARGQSVSVHDPSSIFTKHDQLYLDGVPVLENDVVWFRCDPVCTENYYELLERLKRVNAPIVNAPRSILAFHAEMMDHPIDHVFRYTCSCLQNVKKCYDHLRMDGFTRFLIKTPSKFGGAKIARSMSLDALEKYFTLFQQDSGYVIIQGLADGECQDGAHHRRVMCTPTDIIGMIDYQMPEDCADGCMQTGATFLKSSDLSKVQTGKLKQIQDKMKKTETFLCEIEFLGDTVIGTNVSCPNSIAFINSVEAGYSEYDLIDACHAFINS